jgi:hypothetical protein
MTIADNTIDFETIVLRGRERWNRVLQEQCPSCVDPAIAMRSACVFKGREGCKHRKYSMVQREAEEHVEVLRKAELGRSDWWPLIAGGASPPAPPPDWFASAKDREAHEHARRMACELVEGKAPPVLVLCGATGSGKSLLAAWIACRLPTPCWVRATDADAFSTWDPILLKINKCRTVVYDDVGLERASESGFSSRNVATAICGSIDAGAVAVITSNLTPSQFTAKYDGITEGRLSSRLVESARVMAFGPSDLRRARRAAGEERRPQPQASHVGINERMRGVPEGVLK